mmetsp:Transcript_11712/g.17852  ORF Transcript_11712/g.17852 Transcript_11712/m.17852 type:complete len:340 (+) Transcript_11712:9688-10707(+)
MVPPLLLLAEGLSDLPEAVADAELSFKLNDLGDRSGGDLQSFLVGFELAQLLDTFVESLLDFGSLVKSLLGGSVGANKDFTSSDLLDEGHDLLLLFDDSLAELFNVVVSALLSLFLSLSDEHFDVSQLSGEPFDLGLEGSVRDVGEAFVFLLVPLENLLHLFKLLLRFGELFLAGLARFQLVHEVDVRLQGGRGLAQSSLNFVDAVLDVLGLLFGQLQQILLHVSLLVLHFLAQARGQAATLDRNQTLVVRSSDASDVVVPSSQLLKIFLNALQVGVLLLPLFEDEFAVKLVDFAAFLVLSHIFLQLVEVLADASLDSGLRGGVGFTALNDGSEARTTV